MHKKLTITLDERVYYALHKNVGKGLISQSIEDLAAAYREMDEDEEREAEALEWTEATIGDVGSEPR